MVAGGDFAPLWRARSRRFADSFCCLSSPANSRHSATLRRRASRAQHPRHQNRVARVTPAGAGSECPPHKEHGKSVAGDLGTSGRWREPGRQAAAILCLQVTDYSVTLARTANRAVSSDDLRNLPPHTWGEGTENSYKGLLRKDFAQEQAC
jgi:hypothetical protein